MKQYTISRITTHDKKTGKPNGMMIPVWKDYDDLDEMRPRYVYYLTIAPGSSKGPYLHTKRRGLLTLLEGETMLVWTQGDQFSTIPLYARENAAMVDIPKGIGYLLINGSTEKEARLLMICDYPWKEGDNETLMPDFSAYSAKKNQNPSQKWL